MKKFRIFAVIVLALVLVLGTIQFCIADPFNVDVEGEGDNVKLVFTLNGKKYELNLNPYTGDVENANKSDTSANGEITIEEAKSIALKDAGVTNATFTKEKRDHDDGRAVYEIEFIYDNKEYEYEIAVSGGSILKKDIDYERYGSTANNSGQYSITAEEAENIALKDAGVSRNDVDFITSHQGRDDGIYLYDVEFFAGDKKYEYEINASKGNILQSDIDYERYRGGNGNNGANNGSTTAQTTITAEEAENIALKDAGVSRSSVRYIKSKLDRDDGRTVYEVEFAVDYTEYEYEINAADGNIISKDMDRD